MSNKSHLTPLLAEDSILGESAKKALAGVVRDEIDWASRQVPDPLGDEALHRVRISWDEMIAQPEAIEETLKQERKSIADSASYLSTKTINRVCIVGCGDSWISGMGVRSLYESLLGLPCEPIQALDFAYYYSEVVNDRTLVLALSSSGNSPRTVEAMLVAQARGAQTIALTNTKDSPLMRAADRSLYYHAVRKGWPTQASTAAMAMMSQLAVDLAREKGYPAGKLDAIQGGLDATSGQVAVALEETSDPMVEIAAAEVDRKLYLFAGGGPAYASAMFGAAKVKEMTPDHSYAVPQEEYHHYYSQMPGDPLVILVPEGPSIPRAVQTVRKGKAWGGQVYGAISKGSPLKDLVDVAFEMPDMDERLSAIVYSVPAQMFAYHVAMAKFSQVRS